MALTWQQQLVAAGDTRGQCIEQPRMHNMTSELSPGAEAILSRTMPCGHVTFGARARVKAHAGLSEAKVIPGPYHGVLMDISDGLTILVLSLTGTLSIAALIIEAVLIVIWLVEASFQLASVLVKDKLIPVLWSRQY
ncbi:hypothetical protein EI94DRAFT_1702182 [Lactarius quietus]|nr:hypothetical protein EI94DRAFT_1702182 [Lactarius quietus]